MTNQEKFIEVFGIEAWRDMMAFFGTPYQYKDFWTSKWEEQKDDMPKM